MTTTAYLTTVLPVSVFMLGTVLSVIWYFGIRIEARFDRIDDRFDRVEARFDARFDRVEERLDELTTDVAVLKATQ